MKKTELKNESALHVTQNFVKPSVLKKKKKLNITL